MLVKVRVKANAKNDSLKEIAPDHFEISVRDDAAENRANHRTIQLLAAHLSLSAKQIKIIKGHHSPSKIVEIVK